MTRDQRTELLRLYHRLKHPTLIFREYQRIHGINRPPCSKRAFYDLITKVNERGSVDDRPKSGRPRISEEEVEVIALASTEIGLSNRYGSSSTRRIAPVVGRSHMTVWRKMRMDLQLFPYQLQQVQELRPGDPQQRFNYAVDVLARSVLTQNWLESILWSDEANFSISGQVNRFNERLWCTDNPHEFIEQPLHSPHVCVWIGLNATTIIGPYFFGEMNDLLEFVPRTVNSERYLAMLRDFVRPRLIELGLLGENQVGFMHDGAPPHIAHIVVNYLRAMFGNRLIGNRLGDNIGNISWPPRSPDLTPCDAFAWGFIKSIVYRERVFNNLDQLREAITNAVRTLEPGGENHHMLAAAVADVRHRLELVVQQMGGHIQHLIR